MRKQIIMDLSPKLNRKLVENSVFIIGSVFSVQGKAIVVKVNKNKNLPHLFYNGRTIKNVSVGLSNYIKILKGFTEIICKVEGEYLEEDKNIVSKQYLNEQQKIERFLNLSVFGFYDDQGKFQHGIKEMPLIGSECYLLSRNEFEVLHQLANNVELKVHLGSLIDEETQKIYLSVSKLFAGHIGIFGNTGSGKSNTLAKMYTELFAHKELNDQFKTKSKFVFIDFNGEYSKEDNDEILSKSKEVFHLKSRIESNKKYPILKTELEKLELLSILLDATEKTQQPFLHRAIDSDWFEVNNVNFTKELQSIEKNLKLILNKNDVNFNQPFLKKFVDDFEKIGINLIKTIAGIKRNLDDITYNITQKSFMLNGRYHNDNPSTANQINIINEYFDFSISRLNDLQQIQFKIFNQYYHEILNGYANQEHISPLIGRVRKRFNMLSKVFEIKDRIEINTNTNIQVIDLKNVNLEIKKVIPLLICKTEYDNQKNRREEDRNNSLNLIIDEAHNILSENSSREAESWKDYRLETFEEIIKEGRKFGVFLTVASQRPSDISPTIISQLHNYFIHRLMNEMDLRAINKAVSYLDKLSFDSISNLSTGCCFIAGQMTQFPLSVKVKLLDKDQRPQSDTVNLDKLWNINAVNTEEN
ncbi:MAG: ATP-binding protein [Saprospiraceae bacterium]|nr:ATP-binding protein [Saprospiraceae bacterium]